MELGSEKTAIVVEGSHYTIAPLTMGGMVRLTNWIKGAPVRAATQMVLEESIPASLSGPLMSQAWRETRSDKRSCMETFNEEVKTGQNEEAVLRMLYECCLSNHPELTWEAIRAWSPTSVQDALDAIGGGEETPANPPAPEPASPPTGS